jgi:hypothetical protein
VTSFGITMLKPIYPLMDELIKAGLKAPEGFTVDPRPIDYANVKCNPIEKLVFDKFMYSKQESYEKQLQAIGLKDTNGFTCTSYLPEIGNTPKEGDVLSWAESSAVVFANSVLGAHCNRNSGVLEMFGMLLGYAPEFGFLTAEGRKATWKVIVKTTTKPEAQILGSAVGMKVLTEVPYVEGLDPYLKPLPDEDTVAYLKDFGAATRLQWRCRPLSHRQSHPGSQGAGRRPAEGRLQDVCHRRCRDRTGLPVVSGDVEESGQESPEMLYRLPSSHPQTAGGLDR